MGHMAQREDVADAAHDPTVMDAISETEPNAGATPAREPPTVTGAICAAEINAGAPSA